MRIIGQQIEGFGFSLKEEVSTTTFVFKDGSRGEIRSDDKGTTHTFHDQSGHCLVSFTPETEEESAEEESVPVDEAFLPASAKSGP